MNVEQHNVPMPTGGSVLWTEKRREPRYRTNDPAEVQMLPNFGHHILGRVVDVSRSGLRLELLTNLPKGCRVEVIILPRKVAIFGEVRYSRRNGAVYHAGVAIEDVVFPRPGDQNHLHDDEISLYAIGKGLTVPEVLRVGYHLSRCRDCLERMKDTILTLHPRRVPMMFPSVDARAPKRDNPE